MLKCSPRPTASPPIPLRCSSQLEPIAPGGDDELVGLDGHRLAARCGGPSTPHGAPVPSVRSARPRTSASTSSPCSRCCAQRQHGVERRVLGRRTRSRCCSSRCRGRRRRCWPPSARSGRAGRGRSTASLEPPRGHRCRVRADRRRRSSQSRTSSIAASQPVAVEAALRPAVEHRLGRGQAERVVDRGAAADAHALQHLQAEVGGQLQRALVVEAQVLRDLVVAELVAGRRAGRARARAPCGRPRRSGRRGSRPRRPSRSRSCRSAAPAAPLSERSGGSGWSAGSGGPAAGPVLRTACSRSSPTSGGRRSSRGRPSASRCG